MYLLMMSLLLCRRRGEGGRKLAKSCRRHLWTAPYANLLFEDLSIHLFLFPDLQAKCEFDVAMTCDSCSTAITEILTKEKGKVSIH